MKVLLINNQHYRKGGAHTVYLNTGNLLEINGHDVFYFSTKDENTIPNIFDKYFPEKTDYRKLSFAKKVQSINDFVYDDKVYIALDEYIKVIRPDIAHIHLIWGGLTISALKALKDNNVPIVHTVHDYRLICPAYLFLDGNGQICEKCKLHKYYKCVTNKCSESVLSQSTVLAIDSYFRNIILKPQKFIDKYLFVSDFAKQKHIDFNYDNESKMSRIYNFLPNLDMINPNHEKGKYLLFFGRLSREKGIETLLESIRNTVFKLKVAGTGPLFNNYKNKKIKNVDFLGFQNGEKLNKLIREASFIVVPSEWYENNPMSIIEAYAFGKPVIGADIGGIPEIIKNNETGLLFESGNIESLTNVIEIANRWSDKEYLNISINARKFALKMFNPNIYYNNLMSLYLDVLKKNNK